MGTVQAPETSMRPGNTPGLSFTKLDSLRLPTVTMDLSGSVLDRVRRLPAVRSIDILSRVCVRAKSEKIGISCRDRQTAPRDGHVFPLMDDLKPLL